MKLAALIDFEAFRPKLAITLKRSDGSKGGRPPYDPCRRSIRCRTTPPSFASRPSGQIQDRLLFMRFLGLGFEDAVPDAKTVWLFREQLTRASANNDHRQTARTPVRSRQSCGRRQINAPPQLPGSSRCPIRKAGGNAVMAVDLLHAGRERRA